MGIKRTDRVPNAQIKSCVERRSMWLKRYMKVLFDGLDILKEWEMKDFLKGILCGGLCG